MRNVAIVGAGKLGQRHAAVYASISSASVTTVVEPDSQRGRELIARHAPEAELVESLDAALESSPADVIDICTPTPMHYSQVLMALQAGKNVFCEKPLTATAAETRAIAEALEGVPGDLRVGFLYRHHPRIALLKQRIERGALGTLYLATMRIGGRGSHRTWKHRAAEGGGALLDMATHMLDLAYWLFGSFDHIEVLQKETLLEKREIDGVLVSVDAEDLIVVRLRTVSGVELIVHADFVTPGFSNSIEVSGTNGSAFTSIITGLPDRYVLAEPSEDLAEGEIITPGLDSDMLLNQFSEFILDLEKGERRHDIEASLQIAKVLDAATGADR